MTNWAFDSIFYHVYPLGLCGAPARNDFGAAPVERLERLTGWLEHIRALGCNASDRPIELAVPAPRNGQWHDLLNGGSVNVAGGVLRAQIRASWARVLRAS